jgi:hypothetical protein
MQDARRSTGERAERSLENNAVSAPQVGSGLNGRHCIPGTIPLSSPPTSFHDRIVEEPRPVTPPIGRWPLLSLRGFGGDLDRALCRSQSFRKQRS